MELSRTQENKNRAVSAGVTTLVTALLLLFLLLYNIITPNPPFPESGGGGGQELALGLMTVGNDRIDYGSMGRVTDVVVKKTKTREDMVTVKGGEAVTVPTEKPQITEDKTVVTPEPPKKREKTAAEKLAEKYKKKTGQDGGGIGDNETAGQQGTSDGDLLGAGTGGSGTGDGDGTGEGSGSGQGPGSGIGRGGNVGIDLSGREVVKPPKLPTDTREEGKVVVEIVVNSEGTVISANPNGRGTTTSSAVLKAKARQAAMAAKFSPNYKYEEQRGTITIIFSFN